MPDTSSRLPRRVPYCTIFFFGILPICLAAFCWYTWSLECPHGEPQPFHLPTLPDFTGPLEPNDVIGKGKRLFVGELLGPESFAVDLDGSVYTGTSDGRIWRIVSETEKVEVFRFGEGDFCGPDTNPEEMEMCSHPLGMGFHPTNGLLYVVDSYHGLFSINLTDISDSKRQSTRQKRANLVWDINSKIVGSDHKMKFLNSFAVLSNGSILLTETTNFPLHSFVHDLLILGREGSLLLSVKDPKSGQESTFKLLDLTAANGLLLSKDESFVLVCETSTSRIIRYYLKGPKAGTWDMFASNLPGYPDNLSYSKRGTVWVAMAFVRDTVKDTILRHAWIRKLMCKFGIRFFDVVAQLPQYGMVVELDPTDGTILNSYHDVGAKVVGMASEVVDLNGDSLYIGSFGAPFLASVKLKRD